MKFILALAFSILSFLPAYAQVKPSSQTSELVGSITEAFFNQLVKEDFETERAFMTKQFADLAPIDEWRAFRNNVIEATGPTPQFAAYKLTYYEEKQLLAAVDFFGQAAEPNTFICGYILWEISAPNIIGLSRFEQNIVSVDIFQSMPVQEAAQMMTNWQCPTTLIETVLGISAN